MTFTGILSATAAYPHGCTAHAEAEPLFREAIEIGEKTLGRQHPDVATRLNNLASLLRATGRHAEAEPLYREAIEISENALGRQHPTVILFIRNFMGFLTQTGRDPEATALRARYGVPENGLE